MPTTSFHSLSAVDKRKAIARDVLSRLRRNQLISRQGVMVRLPTTEKPATLDLQTLLAQGQPCEVCALGAATVGLAHYEDRIKLRFADGADGNEAHNDYRTDLVDERLAKRLRTVLGKHLFSLIEATFEDGGCFVGYWSEWFSSSRNLNQRDTKRVKAFVAKHPVAADRLRLIYARIARTGTFQP